MKIASSFLSLLAASPRVPCAENPALFFGDSQDEDEQYDDEDAADAIAVCLTCPIRHECLSDAIGTDEQWGVRGATTPSQRQQLKARGW